MKQISERYQVVVVGGGMAGVCAAIASARTGAKTVLIQNRPVLGGNTSSEIKVGVLGADCHIRKKNARETGILEEVQLESKSKNSARSFHYFDLILWEKAQYQKKSDALFEYPCYFNKEERFYTYCRPGRSTDLRNRNGNRRGYLY